MKLRLLHLQKAVTLSVIIWPVCCSYKLCIRQNRGRSFDTLMVPWSYGHFWGAMVSWTLLWCQVLWTLLGCQVLWTLLGCQVLWTLLGCQGLKDTLGVPRSYGHFGGARSYGHFGGAKVLWTLLGCQGLMDTLGVPRSHRHFGVPRSYGHFWGARSYGHFWGARSQVEGIMLPLFQCEEVSPDFPQSVRNVCQATFYRTLTPLLSMKPGMLSLSWSLSFLLGGMLSLSWSLSFLLGGMLSLSWSLSFFWVVCCLCHGHYHLY